MADETKDSHPPTGEADAPAGSAVPAGQAKATEGARAETAAAKTSAPPGSEAPAVTAETPKSEPAAAVTPAAAASAEKPAAAAAPKAAAAATAAPAAPAAPKAAATPKADTAGDMTRRGFFSWAAVAWVGFTAAIGGCATAMGRFMFPNVLFEPPTSFKVGKPEDFQAGVVDTRFVDKYGVWVVNQNGRIFSLIAVCTHLGCPPAWLETQNKFKCPCHGSGYYKNGINFEGPTPRPLERARIFLSPDDGQIVVDKAQKFQYELGQWEDPNSYIQA